MLPLRFYAARVAFIILAHIPDGLESQQETAYDPGYGRGVPFWAYYFSG